MPIRLHNTLTRRVEPLETIERGVARMYVCGVTVYDDAHVGHAMSAIVFDIVRRYLEWRGYQVRHVVNFTDVDDKIIARAQALGRDPRELAEGYIRDFEKTTVAGHAALVITLAYDTGRKPAILGVRRVSSPGQRVYARKTEIPRVLGGLGVAIISTSQGLLTDRQARKRNVGGEVLAWVW